MKFVYAGGMTISYQILKCLCEEGEKPLHVFGYPPTLAHRSNYQPLDELARSYRFPLTKITDINDTLVFQTLSKIKPDWFFIFGWSQLVNKHILEIPRFGTLGFHMTLLPEGRGRAPIAWTIIKGKTVGGVSLIWLEPGADSGPIALQRTYNITLFDDAETVVQRVNSIACTMIRDALPDLRKGTLPKIPQDNTKATYWRKRTPKDGLIDWKLPVKNLYNFIRGITHPFPCAFSFLDGEKYIFLKVAIIEIETSYFPGTIIGPYYSHGKDYEAGIAVATKGGLLIIKRLLFPSGNIMEKDELLNYASLWKGKCFQ